MKILVTGGAGFIGSNLVDALIEANHDVFVVDNLSTGNKANLNKQARFYETDICDKIELQKIFEAEKPETIFHLAAQASVSASIENPALDVTVNVIGTINLLELARDFSVKKFVFSSTGGAIYGEKAPRPTSETAEEKPLTPYGMNKLQAERYIEFFAGSSDMKTVVLRYSNVYGPRQNPHGEAGVVAIFTDRMIANESYKLYGDGEQTRDFIYVSDVVEANFKALEYDRTGTFNIGSGKETTINDVTRILHNATQTSLEPTREPAKLEQRHSCLDSTKAQEILGWSPSISIEEGLEKTISFYKGQAS
jgi:UDP-glucose 4-epimerase